VVVCFQVGGRDAYAVDMEIPRRYGVDQTVGDTLGPGGVFRGLRSMKALEEITRDMQRLCPDALLLNYANPMAINCWFASTRACGHDRAVPLGAAHGRRARFDIMGLEPGSWSFRCAGINHQAWMLDFRHRGRDAMPELRTAVNEYHRGELAAGAPHRRVVRRRP
jgi:alpha-galactosidase